MGQVLKVAAHFGGSHLHLAHQLLLHLLHLQSLAGVVAQVLAYLAIGLVEILLHLLARTNLRDEVVRIAVHLLDDLVLAHLDAVQLRLVEEELLHGQLFGDDTIGVCVEPPVL